MVLEERGGRRERKKEGRRGELWLDENNNNKDGVIPFVLRRGSRTHMKVLPNNKR
jgi:hypothetical protein